MVGNTDDSNSSDVVLAKVGKPHGLKGWVRINSFTDPSDNILQYRHFSVMGRQSITELVMDQGRLQGTTVIAHFKGYDDPEQARELLNLDLKVSSQELPELDTGEYYWYQLEGLTVVTLTGDLLGKVSKLLETGANDVLVVSSTKDSIDDRERLIPYLPDTVVRQVDLESKTMQVDWEADYLA